MNTCTLLVSQGADNLPYHHVLPQGTFRPVGSTPGLSKGEQVFHGGLHFGHELHHPFGGVLLSQPVPHVCEGIAVQPEPFLRWWTFSHGRDQPLIKSVHGFANRLGLRLLLGNEPYLPQHMSPAPLKIRAEVAVAPVAVTDDYAPVLLPQDLPQHLLAAAVPYHHEGLLLGGEYSDPVLSSVDPDARLIDVDHGRATDASLDLLVLIPEGATHSPCNLQDGGRRYLQTKLPLQGPAHLPVRQAVLVLQQSDICESPGAQPSLSRALWMPCYHMLPAGGAVVMRQAELSHLYRPLDMGISSIVSWQSPLPFFQALVSAWLYPYTPLVCQESCIHA